MKTLEDIKHIETWQTDNPDDIYYTLKEEELKDVAKEWIEQYKKGYCFVHESNHLDEWKDDNECVCFDEGVIWALETFFNLKDKPERKCKWCSLRSGEAPFDDICSQCDASCEWIHDPDKEW